MNAICRIIVVFIALATGSSIANAQSLVIAPTLINAPIFSVLQRKHVDSGNTPIPSTVTAERLDAMLKRTDVLRESRLLEALENANQTLDLAKVFGDPNYLTVAKLDKGLLLQLLHGKNSVPSELAPSGLAIGNDAPQSLRLHYHESRLNSVIWNDQVIGFGLHEIMGAYRKSSENCSDPELVIQQRAMEVFVRLFWLSERTDASGVALLINELDAVSKDYPYPNPKIAIELWNSKLAYERSDVEGEIDSLRRALRIAQATGNRFFSFQCCIQLKRCYAQIDKENECLNLSDLSISLAEELGAQPLVMTAIAQSAIVNGKFGNHEVAAKRFQDLEASPGFDELDRLKKRPYLILVKQHLGRYQDSELAKSDRSNAEKILTQDEVQEIRNSDPEYELYKQIQGMDDPQFKELILEFVQDDPDAGIIRILGLASEVAENAAQATETAKLNVVTAKANAVAAKASEQAAIRRLEYIILFLAVALLSLVVVFLWLKFASARSRIKRISFRLDNEKKNVSDLSLRIGRLQRMESLGLMAGSVAHDFNNILVGVLGNAEILQIQIAAGQYDDVDSRIDNIIVSSEKAAGLSRQMLAYAGKQAISKHAANLNDVVVQFESVLRSSCRESQSLDLDLCSSAIVSMVDEMQVEQVLLNLVTNASKASGNDGQILIRTGDESIDDIQQDASVYGTRIIGGDFCFIEVSDQGAGISQSDLERIFEPFFTSSDVGRGLGLSVVYGVAEGHDGFIRCQSIEGEGTTIRVYFPKSDLSVASSTEEGMRIEKLPSTDWNSKQTILVIDDEECVMDLCCQLLHLSGYNVISAIGGREGIGIITDSDTPQISCVLMDVLMPEMGANELLQKLENLNISIPVVLMSGFSQTRLEFLLQRPNVASILQKPFRSSDLRREIYKATQLGLNSADESAEFKRISDLDMASKIQD